MGPFRVQPATAAAVIAAIVVASAAPCAAAQPARLLSDVSDRPLDHPNRDLLPPSAVVLDEIVYFSHDDGVTGHELWRSDGTETGTWRVRDICPGRCWGMVQEIAVAGDRLFFSADDGIHGAELWTSDGTAAGTRIVADIGPGLGGSRPGWMTALGDRVFFSADDGIRGREPWISDGTPGGTEPLADLRPGQESSRPSDAVALGSGVLFFADDGAHGREPWLTDGSEAGTSIALDIRPGSPSSFFGGQKLLRYPPVIAFAGRAWFSADDGIHGQELWFSDGTAPGTGLAADLVPGAGGAWPEELTATASRLYFRAEEPSIGSELFSTDGTTTGLVADLHAGPQSAHPFPIGTLGERLVFVAFTSTGFAIWSSDGTAEGTGHLVDLFSGPEDGDSSAWMWPARTVGDLLYFGAGPAAFDAELWSTDGTAEGTRQVAETWPGLGAGLPIFFGPFAPPVALGERLFFFAAHPDLGWEPWISDGTTAGTHVVRDVYSTPGSQIPAAFDFDSSHPIDANGRLYFVGVNWTSFFEPWTSRGTPQSTRQVAETVPGTAGAGFVWPVAPLGTRLVLFVRAGDHEELWVTEADGSGADLLSIVEWSGGFGTSFSGRAFFDVEEEGGSRLWVSDGTPDGTGRFLDTANLSGGWPAPFAELDRRLYFFGDGELWSTDGTTAGTSPVSGADPTTLIGVGDFLVGNGDRLFFTARGPDAGHELWTSDGTGSGTVPLPEVRPGPESGFIDRSIQGNPTNFTLVSLPGGVAFVGDDGVRGEEPWWSDGVGVAPIGDLRPGARGSEPRWLTAAGGALFFAADDGVDGRELWRWRPGEAAAMVADLVPGAGSSLPQEMLGVDGLLYFSAFTPERGVELWRSDGTAAGTVPLEDLWPGEESSTPSRLTASGRYLFFTADDGVHGREMWSRLLPTRRPRAFLSAGGALVPGGQVVLTLRLENPPPEEMPDGDGDELSLPLPAILEVIEVTASGNVGLAPAAAASSAGAGPRSVAAAADGGEIVTWNGALPPGGSVEIVVVARVRSTTSSAVSLQAIGGFDSDGDGTNDEPLVSDDPRLPGEDDATVLAFVIEVPALGPGALAALAAALALLALFRLRRTAAG